ncbi:hypothetical protein SEA_FRAYBELL_76 [Mycobacterium phage FrayBell]|uniref:Uncharacterized protein n=2 Tax=Bixzunavirus TaxID=680114 RepID=A0A411CCN2_9CAUD|nr:hypothetical protein KHO58_gp076 [Mycobacterium phage Bigswole]YP_010057944.1 hypothetical protein KHO62_gp070 [Mycobacterium phage NoodleTree]ATN87750.1 hypothetical protein SEA_BIGSWOLE_76 [Mycobacterium phage Bigswole]QAY06297.1 hypothetical protein SEA_FRAYBELL_76 [Mycobacterium phage FrayBell]QAY11618.1 hypothetical protein SEA_NOODLETREE_70 [Mycobacterium phage NoodleTree]
MAKHAAAPTLGDIAEQLREWKDVGVTLESLQWVIREQVYFEEVR